MLLNYVPCLLMTLAVSLPRVFSAVAQFKLLSEIFGYKAYRCQYDEMLCNNQQCVLEKWRCDGIRDCLDGSDEQFCNPCPVDEYSCATFPMRCLPGTWRCDGIKDCEDGSDEMDCPPSFCLESQYLCQDGVKCLPKHAVCDGVVDCIGGDDEDKELCPVRKTCAKGEVLCANKKQCVLWQRWCNGRQECEDNSDENNDRCPGAVMIDGCKGNHLCFLIIFLCVLRFLCE